MQEHRWPIANPNFLERNPNDEYTIVLKGSNDLPEEFLNYAMKFRKAGYLLTEHVLDTTDISKLDNYFFSIAYLYRHSLELILKAIGFKYINLLEERKSFLKDTFHNLSSILNTIYPYIQGLITGNRGAYDWLETFFADMNDIDKESDSFRYPFGITINKEDFLFETTKHYAIKLFFEKQIHIDLVAFVNKMEVSFDILKNYYYETLNIKDDYKEYNPIFIEEGGSYYGQSVLGYSYSRNKFYPYVKAYNESADYLYEYIMKNEDLKELLFIPICYLYRNAIELAMKEILFEECSYEFQAAIKLVKRKKHSILSLWNAIVDDIVKHSNAPEDDDTLDNVAKYVNQLHDIDGSSDKFRYPTDKYLNLHFKKEKRLDIHNVCKFFSEFATFLSAVCTQMSVQNELKAEMQAEYRAEMEAEYSNDYDQY